MSVPAPEQAAVERARARHRRRIARKLGWSGRTVTHLLGCLSNADLVRCAFLCPAEARALVLVRLRAAIAAAPGGRARG